MPYGEAWALQRALVAERAAGAIPDTLLLLEHDPVVTLGRDGNRGSLLLDEAGFAARGVELVESDRGGDATFHGPGQLVAYPILDLKPDLQDVGKFVRGLEQAMIDTVADYGLTAGRDKGNPGVWLDDPPRKIGAIGARISRWITHHGVALNVNVDLAYFGLIVPCGIVGKGVTSLQRELGRVVPLAEVEDALAAHLATRFGRALVAEVPPIDHNGPRS